MKLIKLKAVMDCTGLGRPTVYNYIAENQFSKPVSLGARAVAWECRIEERDLENQAA
jgi:prophage regulatory protein